MILFLAKDDRDSYSIPMHLTCHTEPIRGVLSPGDAVTASWVSVPYLSIIPTKIEAHTGFTAGKILCPLTREVFSGIILVNYRLSWSYVLWVCLLMPIWQFNLYRDLTSNCYVTDTLGLSFRYDLPRRSYKHLGLAMTIHV